MADTATLNGQLQDEIAVATEDPRFIFGGRLTLTSTDPVLRREAHGRIAGYRDLMRDGKVTACISKRKDMTLNAPLLVKVARRRGMSVRRIDVRLRDMVQFQIETMGISRRGDELGSAVAEFDTSFNGALRGHMEAFMLGFAPGEIMWERVGREIVAREIMPRRSERFLFDREHRMRLLTSRNRTNGIELPHRKFVTWTFNSAIDPYGRSLGYTLYWLLFFKRQDLSFWLRFVDKYGGPTAVAKYPKGTKPTGKNSQETALAAAKAVNSATALAIPDNMSLELLQSITAAAQQGFDQLAKFLNGEIAQAILGVTLTTEITGVGSRALGEVHQSEQLEKGRNDGQGLMGLYNTTLVRWITDFNAGFDVPSPHLLKVFPDVEWMTRMAGVDNTLGQVGYRRKLDSVNQIYGFGEEVYEEKEAAVPVVPPGQDAGDTAEMWAAYADLAAEQGDDNVARFFDRMANLVAKA